MDKEELRRRIDELVEMEARSCSMEPSLMTPEYIFRLLGGSVPLKEIEAVM
ncbi:MAG: hypothetical protein IJX11_10005 [Bacteroidales bacterium]|nr:hypothetical protein [Bacteroidales bacterium]